jgi:hypothetical protein
MAGTAGSMRQSVSGLARASGTSLGDAARSLQAAKQIETDPRLAAAVRFGELSRQQAVLVAGAVANNPSSAPQLLDMARSCSMRELADESPGRALLAKAAKRVARRCNAHASCVTGPAKTAPST